MQKFIPDVVVIHDEAVRPADISGPLSTSFTLQETALETYVRQGTPRAGLYVFFTNPRVARTQELLRTALEVCDGARIFVLPTHSTDAINRLYALGIDDYVVLPIEPAKLRALARDTMNRDVERVWAALEPAKKKAFQTSLKCFEKCFVNLKRGEPLPLHDIEDSCHHIREAAALGGLNNWIDALDRHHNYSFRHSMFVCGSLTYFAHAIGIRGRDLELLTIGGLLHDIGKSNVPTAILDKPGKLDPREWEIMKKHPVWSEEILLHAQDLDRSAVDMAVSHHERLDGAGYPRGLSAATIDDFVRMTAIADVYSALIDKRAYKGSMTSAEALAVMERDGGHLDADLLRAFKSFVLDDEAGKPGLPKQYVA